MKKNIIKICAGLVFIGAVVYTTNLQKNNVLDELSLDNAEALASGETTQPCYDYGRVHCSYNGIWVDRQ